jgi:hypothetical protein
LAAGLISVLQCKRPFGKKESRNGIPKGGTHLKRISLRLTNPQAEHLRVEAKRRELPMAELLRRIVDEYREDCRRLPTPSRPAGHAAALPAELTEGHKPWMVRLVEPLLRR